MIETYEAWMHRVRDALCSINMPVDDWQKIWAFDFRVEYKAGMNPDAAAMKANRVWWSEQNKPIGCLREGFRLLATARAPKANARRLCWQVQQPFDAKIKKSEI